MREFVKDPMNDVANDAAAILERLVSFESISGRPTHDILGFVTEYLAAHGITASLSYDEAGERANLFATIGPESDGGVVLNGHTDVVPVEGQNWASDPFSLTRKGDRLFGRGAVDMKGFIACVLASVPHFKAVNLQKPIHIALSYDEETGGHGMPVLLNAMGQNAFRPAIVIVGEPTNMQIVTGHKGGYELRTEIVGYTVHSCDPTKGANAIDAAAKLIAYIGKCGEARAVASTKGMGFEPPYPTFNIGKIEGGAARNATAGWCNIDWEYRPMPGEDGTAVIAEIEAYAHSEILPELRAISPETDIRFITEAFLPALDDRTAGAAAEFVSALTGTNDRNVVSFGTDAGYFCNDGFSTVVFGPGDISRAHKADEYIEMSELAQGIGFLAKVAGKLS